MKKQNIVLEKPLRCIVKLGGAAITCKNEIEKINEEILAMVSSQIKEAMTVTDASTNVPSMDWSKIPGVSDVPSTYGFEEQQVLDLSNFIIVHGAGSFGHFQASRSGVHKGGLHLPLVKAGFVATRISVTLLNHEIVRALAREGIPSIGLPPFACGCSTSNRNIVTFESSQVVNAINSGFVPVLHGDAVLDDLQGCTILSGDVIIRYLADILKPEYVVFPHVLGVYDRPPSDPNAKLLREIDVDEDGSWSILNPDIQLLEKKAVEFTVAAHDTTGGMITKLSEAASIAKLGIDVYIVKAGTSHSVRALKGELKTVIPNDWLGTVVRSSTR